MIGKDGHLILGDMIIVQFEKQTRNAVHQTPT
jgi:hypothetical protein